jgi:hypothetical protein
MFFLCIIIIFSKHIHHIPATISRRKKDLGLLGSGPTIKQLPETMKWQLVLDQVALDPHS